MPFSDKLSGEQHWNTAKDSSCAFPEALRDTYEAIYQERKKDVPEMRKAWLETADERFDFGVVPIKGIKTNLANFLWTDSMGKVHEVCREKLPYTGSTKQELDRGAIAMRVERLVTSAMDADPSYAHPPKHLIHFVMTQLMLEPSVTDPANSKLDQYLVSGDVFPQPYREAIDLLLTVKRDWTKVQEEFDARSEVCILGLNLSLAFCTTAPCEAPRCNVSLPRQTQSSSQKLTLNASYRKCRRRWIFSREHGNQGVTAHPSSST